MDFNFLAKIITRLPFDFQRKKIQLKSNFGKIFQLLENWYFVTKIVLTYFEKKSSSDREKLLKFEAEGREFSKFLTSLEQFNQTVKGQKNFW